MRLLVVIAELGAGGAETLAADLVHHRIGLGDEVTVASAGGRRADQLAAVGARLLPVPLQRRSARRTALAAARLAPSVRRGRFDLVHAHNVGATLLAHLAVRWPGRRPPLLTTVHGLVATDHGRAVRVLRRCSDVVVAVSAGEAAALRTAGLPDGLLRVVDNGVAARPPHDRAAARAALGLDADVPVAVSVARLARPKRPDLLLNAWELVPPPGLLLLVGDGPLGPAVRAEVARRGLADRVRVLGERHDVETLLAAADVFCLASDSEGMPVAVLEAWAAGVPVVASAVGGLLDGAAGAAELVRRGDAGALARAVTELFAAPERRSRLVAAGRARVAERFSVEGMRAAYDALYAASVR